jgi:hypothetical protein
MNRVLATLLLALCLTGFACGAALADEAGVLTEGELAAWLNALLRSTVDATPLNAPVGEESLTADGYAFLYPQATLYYNKPLLDAQSALAAVAVTDGALAMPRGVRLGAPAEMLMAAYGWLNPDLTGDATAATLYTLDQLPDAAYWAWAQRAGGTLQSVQCGIHARMGEGRYTDTGVIYTVENGEVSDIRIYGLRAVTDLAGVRANLAAMGGGAPAGSAPATGVTTRSDAQPFAQSDLQFARLDFLTLNEKGALALLGAPAAEDWAQEADGDWLHTLAYPAATLVFTLDANRENARLDSLSIMGGGLAGPRGLAAGMGLTEAMALFAADGAGRVAGQAALLYGDGQTPPFGTLERDGATGAAKLRYATVLAGGGVVALHLTFVNDTLIELMIYRY